MTAAEERLFDTLTPSMLASMLLRMANGGDVAAQAVIVETLEPPNLYALLMGRIPCCALKAALIEAAEKQQQN